MTNREFFTAIINTNGMDAELVAFAEDAIAKLNARNEKRSSKPSKAAIANAPIKDGIVTAFGGNTEKWVIASEVATEMGISTSRASALLVQLVKEGVLRSTDTKVPKKGKVKAYALA